MFNTYLKFQLKKCFTNDLKHQVKCFDKRYIHTVIQKLLTNTNELKIKKKTINNRLGFSLFKPALKLHLIYEVFLLDR